MVTETIKADAVRKWEAIVAGERVPEDLAEKYFAGCSLCSAFATINSDDRVADCGDCPLDCRVPGSDYIKWLDSPNRYEEGEKYATKILERIKALEVEHE